MLDFNKYIKQNGYQINGQRGNNITGFAVDVLGMSYVNYTKKVAETGLQNLHYKHICKILDATGLTFKQYRKLVGEPKTRATSNTVEREEGEACNDDELKSRYKQAHDKKE